jgi:hypothetical protein
MRARRERQDPRDGGIQIIRVERFPPVSRFMRHVAWCMTTFLSTLQGSTALVDLSGFLFGGFAAYRSIFRMNGSRPASRSD